MALTIFVRIRRWARDQSIGIVYYCGDGIELLATEDYERTQLSTHSNRCNSTSPMRSRRQPASSIRTHESPSSYVCVAEERILFAVWMLGWVVRLPVLASGQSVKKREIYHIFTHTVPNNTCVSFDFTEYSDKSTHFGHYWIGARYFRNHFQQTVVEDLFDMKFVSNRIGYSATDRFLRPVWTGPSQLIIPYSTIFRFHLRRHRSVLHLTWLLQSCYLLWLRIRWTRGRSNISKEKNAISIVW